MINFFCRAGKELHITFSIYSQDENGHLQLCPESQCGGVPLLVLHEGHCCELFFDRGLLYSAIEGGVKSRLNYSTGDISRAPTANMDHCVHIPSFLEGLVNHKIGVWVRNAFQALEMQENEKYKVESDAIYPVDFEHTGVVERNKKLGDGLQQFLEMKHQRKLSNMSVITNYLSNVTFFKKYSDRIFGTTGTLGNEIELDTLREVYHGLQACRIPSFKQSKLFEAETIIVDDEDSWRERICSAVLKQTRRTRYRGARATLVLCETIKKATIIHDSLKCTMDDDEKKMLKLYTDSSDEDDVTTHELAPGEVIVATNLAGRGTDFQVCEKVKNAGGLFVILTFLASNCRVEQQAFGRSARQGSPGSAQLMLCSLHLPEDVQHELQTYIGPEAVRLELAKRARDKLSQSRTRDTSIHDLPIVTQREELFSTYCTILDKYVEDKQLRQMTVAMLNEYWGIWLLMKSEDIKHHRTKQLTDELKIQISQAHLSFKQSNSPHSSIYHYIKFANKLLAQREYEKSSELYTKAIELDSNWAAIAFYYRALCSYKMQNKVNMNEEAIAKVVQDLKKAKESVNLFIYQCQVIQCLLSQSEGNVKQNVGRVQSPDIKEQIPMENVDPKQEDTTKELDVTHKTTNNMLQDQIVARINMWGFFLNNIDKVIGEMSHFKGIEMKATLSLMKSPSMDDHRAMYRLYQLGLERIFGARESIRFRWEGLAIIGLGATQILAGIAIGDIGLNLLNLEGPFGVLTKQGY